MATDEGAVTEPQPRLLLGDLLDDCLLYTSCISLFKVKAEVIIFTTYRSIPCRERHPAIENRHLEGISSRVM